MDSRFKLKVEFTIYGQTAEWDCSLNWTTLNGEEIDARITRFFSEAYEQALAMHRIEALSQSPAGHPERREA
jgi:hypothetical protein